MGVFTAEYRLKIYEQALSDFSLKAEGTFAGFCLYFFHKGVLLSSGSESEFERVLPELWEQRPKHNKPFWWAIYRRKPRIRALKAAIKEVKRKIK